MIVTRIKDLLAAIDEELPALARETGRIRFGADVTLRRTVGAKHGDPAPHEKHDPSAAHCDSYDGTILGFGLCSTKLGTPTYPTAAFPYPISLFISQSRTGKNLAVQVSNVNKLGPLRPWRLGSFVVMPAATAHSKPTAEQIASQNRAEHEKPRWFVRTVLRVHIPDLWRKETYGGRTAEAREERLALSILVAKHVWGDAKFAAAATQLSQGTYWSVMEKMKVEEAGGGATRDAKTRGRQRQRTG